MQMEATYDIQPIAVTPYDPANGNKCLPPVTATAFYVPLDRVPAAAPEVLPQERYIRIITAGVSVWSSGGPHGNCQGPGLCRRMLWADLWREPAAVPGAQCSAH